MKLPSRHSVLKASGSIAAIIICYSWLIRPWIAHWGATRAEIAESAPSRAVRAVTIDAPPERVWPWLAQIGQTRGGFYSYTWLENLLGCNMVNAARIHPEWQALKPGDKVYLAPPDQHGGKAHLVAARVENPRTLVLVSPPDWSLLRDGRRATVFVWSFQLREAPGGGTRLVVRTAGETTFAGEVFLEPAHFIMERAMLLGIKSRAESTQARPGGDSVDWRPFQQRNLFGYADSAGVVHIAPRFVEAGAFEAGRAVVATRVVAGLGAKFERRYGVIDRRGSFVIPPAFRYISHFREGLAIATVNGTTFGYIDPDGVWVLPPRFAEASDFESGVALVLPLGELAFAQVDTEGRLQSLAGGAASAVVR